jgi:hypothetical protein
MNPSPEAFKTTAEIESAKRRLISEMVGGGMVTLVAIMLLGCVTYGCTRPAAPRPVDHELQAQRVIEHNRMVACVRAGGSWLPVIVRYANGATDSQMSCVTDRTLPLVQAMNTPPSKGE